MLSSHECATSAYTKTQNRSDVQCESTFRVALFAAIIRPEIFDQSFFPLFLLSLFRRFSGNSRVGENSPLAKNFSFDGEYIYPDIRLKNKNIAYRIIRPRMKRGEMLFLVPVIFPNGTFFVVQHPTTDCIFLFIAPQLFFFLLPRRGDRCKNK